jgi:hypothetical protein
MGFRLGKAKRLSPKDPLPANPHRGGCRSTRTARLHRPPRLSSDDVIAAHNGADADMRIFGDHGKVADLRIAIDQANCQRGTTEARQSRSPMLVEKPSGLFGPG